MNFKNALEQRCFEIARDALGPSARLEHNKQLQIESALFAELAAFKGPPTKEIDVLLVDVLDNPRITLLVSCKELSKRAEPAHVQEWAAVVRTMNNYSDGTVFLGMVVSSGGFTAGCEAWATSHNLGLIPPLKGRSLAFSSDTVLRMFARSLTALQKRIQLKHADLAEAPAFFDFVFSLVSDFEGHEEAAQNARYIAYPERWASSFAEMYSSVAGHHVENLVATDRRATILSFSDEVACRFTSSNVEFGSGIEQTGENTLAPVCLKNLECEPCTLEFLKAATAGLPVTSAADFGDYVEFGLDGRFNLRMFCDGFQLVSTESPIETHRL
jgi:hypothetical protein